MNPPAVKHSASQCPFLTILLMADCVKECIFIFRGRGISNFNMAWGRGYAVYLLIYVCNEHCVIC